MATRTRVRAEGTALPVRAAVRDPGTASFWLLRLGFTAAPILAGADKFFDWMTDWSHYLWVGLPNFFNVTPERFMYGVGAVEIVAGLCVLFAPRFGAPLVAAWLAGIVTNLVVVGITRGEYWDIALRDFGLLLGAISLTLMAWRYRPVRS